MKITLGTRGSKLALAQTELVIHQLHSLYPYLQFDVQVIHTRGDIDLKSPLYAIGGKGVFIKELEYALKEKKIDIAVHSLKDMTSTLFPGLQLSAFLRAESVADVLILHPKHLSFEKLPEGSVLATGSLRRKALLKKLRPDIQTVDIRGNILTRIAKLEENTIDGLILSEAGLIRLNLQHLIAYRFSLDQFCPAPGQGVIALETRKDHPFVHEICQGINDQNQMIQSTTELAFLEKIQFDCQAPMGLHVMVEDHETLNAIGFLSNAKMDRFLEPRIKMSMYRRMEDAYQLGKLFIDWKEKNDKR